MAESMIIKMNGSQEPEIDWIEVEKRWQVHHSDIYWLLL